MQDKTDQLQILSQKDSVFFTIMRITINLNLLIFSVYFFLQNIKIKLVLQQPGAILVQTTMK